MLRDCYAHGGMGKRAWGRKGQGKAFKGNRPWPYPQKRLAQPWPLRCSWTTAIRTSTSSRTNSANSFAADVPAADAALMAATQRPISEAALKEVWRTGLEKTAVLVHLRFGGQKPPRGRPEVHGRTRGIEKGRHRPRRLPCGDDIQSGESQLTVLPEFLYCPTKPCIFL